MERDVEARLGEMQRRLTALERRLEALETGTPAEDGSTVGIAPPSLAGDDLVDAAAPGSGSRELLPLLGRTFVVLGGAFLLRAVTEAQVVPQAVGVALGVVYAVSWLLLADRAAARGQRRSATFHGAAAAVISFPLLWEATVQFGFPPPVVSAVSLAVITALGLAVVARRRLVRLAWIFTLGPAVTMLALAVSTRLWPLFVFELLALALAILWLAHDRNWPALGGALSILVTGTIGFMTLILLLGREDSVSNLFASDSLLAIQLAWVVVLFATLGYRTVARSEEVGPWEIVNGPAGILVGVGGAAAVTLATPVSGVWLGTVGASLVAGLYGVAFAVADRRLDRRRTFVFYSTLAMLVVLLAPVALLRGPALAWALSVVALVTASLGAGKGRATLSLHSAVYVIAAAVASGLAQRGIEAFFGGNVSAMGSPAPVLLAVMLVALVFFWLPVASHGRTWGRFSRVPKIAVMVVLLIGIAAIAVPLGVRVLPPGPNHEVDPAAVAALRTGLLALAAVVVAWLGLQPRWPEATWLVYPLLIIGGSKLLLEDVRAGRPVTLFFSFVLYGGALIVAPRLAKRTAKQ